MPKRGALNPTYPIYADSDLAINGGRWKIKGGVAQPVTGYSTLTVGNRNVKQGAAQVVYPISPNDLEENGGVYKLRGGQPISVMDFNLGNLTVLGDRKIQQGEAVPVFSVSDDQGTYEHTWPLGYAGKVLGTQASSLVAYWPFWEQSGAVADNLQGNAARDGGIISTTLAQTGIGDGHTSFSFDGADDIVDCGNEAGLNNLADDAYTVMAWIKADSYGEGNNGTIYDKGNQFFVGWIFGINNAFGLICLIRAGTNASSRSGLDEFTDDGLFHHVAFTYDDAGARVIRLFIDGGEVTSYQLQQAALGAIAADAARDLTIGNRSGIDRTWDGNIQHPAIWNAILTDAEIANLAVI